MESEVVEHQAELLAAKDEPVEIKTEPGDDTVTNGGEVAAEGETAETSEVKEEEQETVTDEEIDAMTHDEFYTKLVEQGFEKVSPLLWHTHWQLSLCAVRSSQPVPATISTEDGLIHRYRMVLRFI